MIIAVTEMNSDNRYYVVNEFSRALLSSSQNAFGNEMVVSFRDKEAKEAEQDEIVVVIRYGTDRTPYDINNAVYNRITMLNDMSGWKIDIGVKYGEWYAITDIDRSDFWIK